ncbi:hypothetical protein F8561_00475 [Enterobacter sp. 198]|nr:hypothetical protein F8561_00475 [Enterobacter sp. 198]
MATRGVIADTSENKSWSKYTLGGQLQMVIPSPAAFEQFDQGKAYFIDIYPTEQAITKLTCWWV